LSDFTPSRLELARKRRGLTKKALSDKAGISVRSITDYEAGTKTPGSLTRARLADALEFPQGFFGRPKIDAPPLAGSSFRALTRMTATKRDQALSAGALALEFSRWIDARFHLPVPAVPRYRGVAADMAAEATRNEWGLGERPIHNMIDLLEAHGVRVFSLAEETRDIDAFSYWVEGVPYVFLNTMKSAEHSRMDAAHELGHLVLHSQHETPRGREEEQDANLFGAAFLMPRSSVIAEAPRGGRINDLLHAKRRWNVSLASLAYRMHQLGLLTEWQYRSVFIEISSRGYQTEEPNGIAGETSQVLGKVFKALREEGLTQMDIAHALELPVAEFRKMVFGLVMTGIDGKGMKPEPTKRPTLQVV
jgi:Zn-dependent peptidase ImmA (M78 family)/DNA-binding XRE family transcriptional regulator